MKSAGKLLCGIMLISCLLVEFVSTFHFSYSFVQKKFLQSDIIPLVLTVPPKQLLQVTFEGGASAYLGNELNTELLQSEPTVTFEADPQSFYTLCMADPDSPNRKDPVNREFKHWLMINIKGNDVNSGDVLAEYMGADPAPGSGAHRYVLLVFKQRGKIEAYERKLTKGESVGRGRFSLINFVKKYNLIPEPVAGNFFIAQQYENVEINDFFSRD